MIGVKGEVRSAGWFVAESVEEAVEDPFSADLAFVSGVVALAAGGGLELDGGDEEGVKRPGFSGGWVVPVADAVGIGCDGLRRPRRRGEGKAGAVIESPDA